MTDCIDKIGQPLAVGDYIAYGHAMGRCAGIRIGKILNINSKPGVRGTAWSICVIGVDDDWDMWEPSLQSSKGTLQFPTRIIRLRVSDVPVEYIKLLESVSYDSKIPKIPWSERRKRKEQ